MKFSGLPHRVAGGLQNTMDMDIALVPSVSLSRAARIPSEATMFRKTNLLVLATGILATMAACHEARPAQSVTAPQAECDANNQPVVDGSARAAFGYAPETRHTVACSPLASQAPAARPLNAPEATDPNDPARLRDIP